MRVRFRYIKKFLDLLLALVAAYFLTAGLLSLLRTHPPPHSCGEASAVFIATNGVHLYVILPAALLSPELRRQLAVPEGVSFLSFGWGDRAFYLETPAWSDLKARTALRALLWRSESAVHVAFYDQPRSTWRPIDLCPDQLASLNQYLEATFRRDAFERLQPIATPAGYGSRDRFYEGQGYYTCFHTCNNWVNEALKAADVPTAVWSPFDRGVWWKIEEQDVKSQ